MTGSASNVVRIKDYLQPPPPRQKSQYELYPLPFFKAAKRRGAGGCTWHVTPTGSYSADYEIGQAYAVDFFKSCDGTVGWSMLLTSIVDEMILAGPRGKRGNGDPTSDARRSRSAGLRRSDDQGAGPAATGWPPFVQRGTPSAAAMRAPALGPAPLYAILKPPLTIIRYRPAWDGGEYPH